MTIEKLITHPDKVFWPEEGYTKLDLARFYDAVFPKLKPYVADRMLSLERCPGGMGGQCFYQKEAPQGLPGATKTKLIQHQNGWVNYVLGGARDTQIALANLGCIAVHAWGSRSKNPEKPDWMVFDLDPGSGEFADAANAGLLLKELLDRLRLTSFPKTSGSRGLHVFVPLKVGPGFAEVREFANRAGELLAAAHPKELTVEQRIQARKKRTYLDSFRNGFGATVVTPYSVRRRPHAPFSMPLRWDDVKPSLDPAAFNLGNYKKLLQESGAWADFFDSRQSLKAAAKILDTLSR